MNIHKNIQNTIPHPAPEEICCFHESHPVRESKKQKQKKTQQDGDRQIDKVWSVEKTLRFQIILKLTKNKDLLRHLKNLPLMILPFF